MKNFRITLLFLLFISLKSIGQQDPALTERLKMVLKVTQEMDTEKILDLSYPKLFDIVPRETMAEAITGMYSNEAMTITLDSLQTKTIFPIFKSGEGQYAKISYSMIMRMKFTETIDSAEVAEMLPEMEADFGKGNIRFDAASNTVIVKNHSELVAIKDQFAKEWCFVNYEAESELTPLLFSNEVVQKLKEYK